MTWEVDGPVGQKDGRTEPGHPACVAGWVSVEARVRWPGRRAWLCHPPAVCAWAATLASLGLSFLLCGGVVPAHWCLALRLSPEARAGSAVSHAGEQTLPCRLSPRCLTWSGPCEEPSHFLFNQIGCICLFYLISLSQK